MIPPALLAQFKKVLEALSKALSNFLPTYETPPQELPMNLPIKREHLYEVAKESIGQDISPRDIAPDNLACVESLCKIIQKACPELQFPTLLSTRSLFEYLERSVSFTPVESPLYGDIILSVTGSGNGTVAHGHCGIYGKKWIMSNDSRTGSWEANYLPESWERYFRGRGGMQTLYYRLT